MRSKPGNTSSSTKNSYTNSQSENGTDECRILEPVFTVKFSDVETSKKYWKAVKEFLEGLLHNDVTPEASSSAISELELHIYANESNTEPFFIMDKSQADSSTAEIPSYELDFSDTLQEIHTLDSSVENEEDNPAKLCCFNCLRSHRLEECLEERDQSRISFNKRKYFASRNQVKSSRYHMEEDPRFSSFRPGYMSRKLREALGLYYNQLPYYIYKMRLLGYPPGWLEEAKMEKSGIILFGSDGNRIANEEDGELVEEEYDFQKIIEYPGFNVYPANYVIDEANYYHMPPILPHNLKINWHFQIPKAVVTDKPCIQRRKPPTMYKDSNSLEQRHEVDMDLGSDNEEQLTLLRDSQKLPVANNAAASSPVDATTRALSPSLEDLEAEKSKLLAQLEQAAEDEEEPKSKLELGTVVPQTLFSNHRIPPPERFAQNICSHIPYENLPNCTGAYKKMSSLLEKVRHQMLQMQGHTP